MNRGRNVPRKMYCILINKHNNSLSNSSKAQRFVSEYQKFMEIFNPINYIKKKKEMLTNKN